MKSLLTLSAPFLMGLCLSACGTTTQGAGTTSPGSASGSTRSGPVATTGAARSTGRSPYLNDGDNDPSDDADIDNLNGKTADDDSDPSEDNYYPENNLYHDRDDPSVVDYGRAASPSERAAITAFVKRYYATAAALNGAEACSMITAALVKSVVESYGKGSLGPSYLRTAKNCAQLMSLVFKHFRARVTVPFTVTGVRVKGNNAYALLGSGTTPASYVILQREGDVWKVSGLLGGPLP